MTTTPINPYLLSQLHNAFANGPLCREAAEEIVRLRDIVAELVDVTVHMATTECTHEDVYYAWESIVRRATGEVAQIIRDCSDPEEGWTWDEQLPS